MAVPETQFAIPRQPGSNRAFAFAATVFLILLSLAIWSCNSTSPDDTYSVTLKLDSTRVGKFDSVRVEIYNGQAPKAGDTTKPVQIQVIKVTPTTKEVTITLNGKVKKDFSVVVTGFDEDAVAYRNLHTVDGFKQPDSTKPSILLVTQINAEELTLSVGETRAPVITVTPSDAKDKKIILTSLDSGKVTVVSDTTLKGIATGIAKVKATTSDGVVAVEFAVTVVAVRVTKLESDSLFLKVGDSVVPVVKVIPDNATDKVFTLESLDTAFFSVDGKAVKARAAGQGKLVLASNDGGAKDTITVRVRVAVLGISAKDLTLEVGDKVAPVLEFDPPNATRQGYVLTTADSSKVAIVGDKDSLEAKAIGQAKVTVKTNEGGFTAEFTVEVARKVIHPMTVKVAALRGLAGDTLAPKPTWDPANTTEQGFTLISLDTSLAGGVGEKLVAKAVGIAKIELTSVDGGIKDTFEVSVETSNFNQDIKPITFSKCGPCHVPPATFNWTDSAQLVKNGSVAIYRLTLPDTAVGHMPIKGADGGPITARELRVLLAWLARVTIPLTSISAKDSTINLGDSIPSPLSFTPANASNKEYKLVSSDSNVVAVRGGILVSMKIGKATIDAESDEGNLKTNFTVSVVAPSFAKNVLPIIELKCYPCHVPPATFNWTDSNALLLDGSTALKRLQLPKDATGRMPLTVGAPNGDIAAYELTVLLGWLNFHVVPLIGITVANDSVMLGKRKAPAITFDPLSATNKNYTLLSIDTSVVDVEVGYYVGIALGTTKVEVKARDGGYTRLVNVKVIPVPVDSITIPDTGGLVGEQIRPIASFFPLDATNQGYTLALLKASTKVRVDSAKYVIGLTVGKDTLEATSLDGAKKGRFAFTVGPVAPKSIVAADTNGPGGNTTNIKPRISWTPAAATDKRFILSVPATDTNVSISDSLIKGKTVGAISTVTVRSMADTSVKSTFKFTVGPVPVAGLSVSATVATFGSTFAPTIAWSPMNATDKGFSLAVPPAAATSLTISGGTLKANHLISTTATVTSTSDGTKSALWSVTVVRTKYTGAVANAFFNQCSQCHKAGSAYPNWQDSATVVAGSNPDTIIARVKLKTGAFMPPSWASIPGPLTGADSSTIVNWLNQK